MKDEFDQVTQDAFFAPMVHSHYQPVKAVENTISGSRWKGTTTPDNVRDLWQTPSWMFQFFNTKVGGFDVDAAANAANALCEEFYDEQRDALSFDWPAGKKYWLNPPFSGNLPWIEHVIKQAELFGSTVYVVLPDDISTKWFAAAVAGAAEMYGMISNGTNTGRVAFISPLTGKPVKENNKGTFVFVFRRHKTPLKTTWLSRYDMENANSDII